MFCNDCHVHVYGEEQTSTWTAQAIERWNELMRQALPRPSVMAFALKMEAQLQRNESRGHWADMPLADILERITAQNEDLPVYATTEGMEALVQTTCADIGNFAMMFSENVVKS